VQRQLQVTLDQLGISQRRLQSLTAELEEIRGNYESVSTDDRFAELNLMHLSSERIDYIIMFPKRLVYPLDKKRYDEQMSYAPYDYVNIT
jgi:hypothetical protein